MTRVGTGVAAGVGLFLIQTIAAPLPVQAASCKPSGQMCLTSIECCTGLCNAGTCA